MGKINSICVYCGSGSGLNEAYEAAARQFGEELAREGIRLVYGGGGHGLMGAVARSTLASGGQVLGIIPEFLKNREHMLREVQELVVTNDMHERKRLMFENSDAFVALPGGIGTLEELVEMLTWGQLGQHSHPVVIANIEGFWDPLLSLLGAHEGGNLHPHGPDGALPHRAFGRRDPAADPRGSRDPRGRDRRPQADRADVDRPNESVPGRTARAREASQAASRAGAAPSRRSL